MPEETTSAAVTNRPGTLPSPDTLVDVPRLVTAYYSIRPDPDNPAQRVSFGTSGHRGSAFDGSFNDDHIAAITQAIVDYRRGQAISRAAVPGEGYACTLGAGAYHRARSARGELDRRDDRRPTRLHAHARALTRDPDLQRRRTKTQPQSPTAS